MNPAPTPLHRQVQVPPDHPAFAGHFPGHPVLPGVVLLSWVIDTAAGAWGGGAVEVPEVKFLSPVGPGALLEIQLQPMGQGWAFTVHQGAELAAKGRLARRPAAQAEGPREGASPSAAQATPAGAPGAGAQAAPPAAKAGWARQAERGNAGVLKVMAAIAVGCGRRMARLVLHPIALYFVLFSPKARRHSRRYLARALGRAPTWLDAYRHVHTFAGLVLDRVYFARGETRRFELQVSGLEHFDAVLTRGRGAVLLGAHLGSFAALHAVGNLKPGLRVAMAMYPDNARMIHDTLRAIAPQAHLDVIALGRPGSMLAVRDWLAAGGLVGMLADRQLEDPSARAGLPRLPFLGQAAPFGDGPLRLAQMLNQPVFFMSALFLGGRRYEVSFEPLADFTAPAANAQERRRQLADALARYVRHLEAACRRAPYNWFNFHDFWQEDAAPGA